MTAQINRAIAYKGDIQNFGVANIWRLDAVGSSGDCKDYAVLKRAIPGAGLWMHPHTGHAINLEEPAAFNEMVGAFLADVDRGMAGRTV